MSVVCPGEQTTLVGKTLSAKVTVQVLNINEPAPRLMLCENLLFKGRFPPGE